MVSTATCTEVAWADDVDAETAWTKSTELYASGEDGEQI